MDNNVNRRRRIFCLILSVIAVAVCLTFIGICFADEMTRRSESAVSGTAETEYVLASYRDRIAVFENGNIVPVEVFDVYISSLPPCDAEAVNAGIHAFGEAELNRAIEDYTS